MDTKPKMEVLDKKQVQSCIELLKIILADRMVLSTLETEQRRELMILSGQVSRPDKLEIMKLAKSYRRSRKRKELLMDRDITSKTAIRVARQAPVYIPPSPNLLEGKSSDKQPKLHRPRACYVCKTQFDRLHFFYDYLCTPCAELNYSKRFQSYSLHGKVALITGARVKIGYQAALMMLRADAAKVIVTTRFPRDAALRFSREKDYEQWSHAVEIHGLDLRHSPSVEHFTDYLSRTENRLDILINNAAQTVRRPPGFYRHLLDMEMKLVQELPKEILAPLHSYEQWKLPEVSPSTDRNLSTENWITELALKGAAIGLCSPSLLSQVPNQASDSSHELDAQTLFPDGKRDADLQQVDLRKMNSWRMKLADVPTPELLEVQLVNSIAPFILCSKLKALMMRTPNRDKHIVNVSAMEGKFTRYTKTDKHPHTNMAKAALNMMTVTSAPDYAKDGIFMNAVDTGWVTDEDPAQLSLRKQEEHDFQPCLDIVDGAARICDPFFSGLITGEHLWGKFLKDYAPTTW